MFSAGQVCLVALVIAIVATDVAAKATKGKELFKEDAPTQPPFTVGWTSRCVNGYTLTLTACQKPEGEVTDDSADDDVFSQHMKDWDFEDHKNGKQKKVPSSVSY